MALAAADGAGGFDAPYRIAIVGGGTSGAFAAASVVELLDEHPASASSDAIDVRVYESTREVLRAMRDARGGGILHDPSKRPRELLDEGYPRGRKEIASLLTARFSPLKQQAWFEDRGVEFRTERDGAVVLADDDGGAGNKACDAILSTGVRALVETSRKVTSIARDADGFELTVQGRGAERCDCLILATGNSRLGLQLARSLGHTIQKPVRSCFSFLLDSTEYFSHLQEEGVRHCHLLPHVRLSYKVNVKGRKRPRVYKAEGPAQLEIRNNSIILGGKAALSLSSSAAFDLKDANYAGSLLVHFCPEYLGGKVELLEKDLWRHRLENPRDVVGEHCPFVHRRVDYDDYDWETESFRSIVSECIPPDLWEGITRSCGAPPGSGWGKMSPKKVRRLAEAVVGLPLEFSGRVTATGDPFVNAGGVSLNEVDTSEMRSGVVDGLFFCGQVLDGDAGGGGFSFMRGFATGRAAGEGAARHALEQVARMDEAHEAAL